MTRRFAGGPPALFLLAFCLLHGPANAQFSGDPVLNQALRQISGIRSMGDMLMDAAKSGADLRNMMADANTRIANARQRYWSVYPNGPGFEAAKREFEAALYSKDFFHLAHEVSGTRNLVTMLGGQVDEGIAQPARGAFDAWAAEVKRNLAEDSADLITVMSDAASAREKIDRAEPAYRQYILRRNLEEFRKQGKSPPGVNPESWRIATIGAGLNSNPDPYITAFKAVAERRTFVNRCPAEVSTLLRKSLTAAHCSCLHGVMKTAAPPYESWKLETEFSEANLLLALVSGPGIPDKVASCLKN